MRPGSKEENTFMSDGALSARSRLRPVGKHAEYLVDEPYIATEKNLSSRPAGGNEMKYLEQVLASGNLSSLMGGTVTPLFEKAFRRLVSSKYSVAMNSCMSALHSAVIAAGAGPGNEVICDSVYVFGAMAVLYGGAIPVFVDVLPTTHNMDPERIEAAITERTKAIIVTHAWGLPAEMDRIMAVARRHKILVIEDAAESLLATYAGRFTGTWGDIGCFSFQASKQLSLGDGGMATVQDDDLYKAVANFAHAPTFLSVAHTLDYNYRINELTSAVGLARLETIAAEIERLESNASCYDHAVEGCDWISLQRGPEGARHSFYYWAANFLDGENAPDFGRFTDELAKAEIPSVTVGYTKMAAYQHPLIKYRRAAAFADTRNQACRMAYDDGQCPVAERIVPRIILGYTIAPDDVVRRDADKLREVIRRIS
jgi:dTDP-4-amino-4,6-dideoxygalactose transaminase